MAPGHPHRVNKVVPGQEANQHRQARPALRLLREANRQADGKNQRHVAKDCPSALFNDVNNLREQMIGRG